MINFGTFALDSDVAMFAFVGVGRGSIRRHVPQQPQIPLAVRALGRREYSPKPGDDRCLAEDEEDVDSTANAKLDPYQSLDDNMGLQVDEQRRQPKCAEYSILHG